MRISNERLATVIGIGSRYDVPDTDDPRFVQLKDLLDDLRDCRAHAAELEAARVKVFALAKGAIKRWNAGLMMIQVMNELEQAIAAYDALAARKP